MRDQREPITITRRGHPLAFIIPPEDLKKLFASQTKRDEAVAAYEAYRQRIRLNANPAADELTDEDINRLVHELRSILAPAEKKRRAASNRRSP